MTVTKLEHYKPLHYLITHIDLKINLKKQKVETCSRLKITQNPNVETRSPDLHLDCKNMSIKTVKLGDKELTSEHYTHDGKQLIIKNVPQNVAYFSLETTQALEKNTDLFGIYETKEGTVVLKAETEGLCRVMPCTNEPANHFTITTQILGTASTPTMLAVGTQNAKGLWVNTIPIPGYLFAIVAGKLTHFSSNYYIEKDKPPVSLNFYIPENENAAHAVAESALKLAMLWDQTHFMFNYPLPEYTIAAVDEFPSGASETFGLNLFNAANLLGSPANRTEEELAHIYKVVSHEYFHMLTGNLTTILNWWNLTVKEGVTKFREDMFFEHISGSTLDRLFNDKVFDERAPRPDAYTNVRSLYNAATYDKSAAIFHMMMRALPGTAEEQKTRFFRVLSNFFKNNTGKSVTLEELVNFLDSNTQPGIMNKFLPWFTESGTPVVHVAHSYNAQEEKATIIFTAKNAKNRPIPVAYAAFDINGKKIAENTIVLKDDNAVIEVIATDSYPALSVLRNFSAPVRVEYECLDSQLLTVLEHDNDFYSKYTAAQKLITNLIGQYCFNNELELKPEFLNTYLRIVETYKQHPRELAALLSLPTEATLYTNLPKHDFKKITEARAMIHKSLANALANDIPELIEIATTKISAEKNGHFNIKLIGNRALIAALQSFQLVLNPDETKKLLVQQFKNSLGHNMTETISALTLLGQIKSVDLDNLLSKYYAHWEADANAINSWLKLNASLPFADLTQRITKLLAHEAFQKNNPNNINALIGTFINNPYGFHAVSGEGYKLVADFILELEKTNPTLAANLTYKFGQHWKQYDTQRQILMGAYLQELNSKAISDEVKSMVHAVSIPEPEIAPETKTTKKSEEIRKAPIQSSSAGFFERRTENAEQIAARKNIPYQESARLFAELMKNAPKF